MTDDNVHETKSPPAVPTPARGSTLRTFVFWLLLGLVVGGVAAIWYVRANYGDSLPEITPADYLAARERWKQAAPADYDIEVQVTGTRPATYRVQVRGGEAVAAWLDDRPLQQQRTFGTWSVPGMFGTMSRDVETVDKRAKGTADASTPRLTLRAEFDSRYGYPAAYRRIQWGSPVEVTWRVTRFEIRSPLSATFPKPRQVSLESVALPELQRIVAAYSSPRSYLHPGRCQWCNAGYWLVRDACRRECSFVPAGVSARWSGMTWVGSGLIHSSSRCG